MSATPLLYCSSCGAANPTENLTCFACQQPLSTLAEESLEPELLHDRYRLLERVGEGGYGAVYRAEDTVSAHRIVAIKQINLHGHTPQEIIEATDTFNREVDLLSGLSHPHLPKLYEHFNDAENWYMVKEFIAGETLEAYLEKQTSAPRAFSLEDILDIGLQLCNVLSYLHTRQPAIIFRDLKPSNIMRTPAGELYLVDFGIARRFIPGKARDTIPFGSPGYAAPEQYGKAQTTPQADIYSLGALLHQLLTGQDPSATPFHFSSPYAYMNTAEHEVEALLMRMVALDPTYRPSSMHEVTRELERLAQRYTPLRQKIQGPPPVPQLWQPSMTTAYYPGPQQQLQQQMNTPPVNRPRRKVLATLGWVSLGIGIGSIPSIFTLTNSQDQANIIIQAHEVATIEAQATAQVQDQATIQIQSTVLAQEQATADVTTAQPLYIQAISGKPFINDPLNDPKTSAWSTSTSTSTYPDGGGNHGFRNGTYHVTNSSKGHFSYGATSDSFADFAFQVQMVITKGDRGGLVFRVRYDYSELYVLTINSTGDYTFWSVKDMNANHDQQLASGSISSFKTGLNQPNLITIIARGSKFYLYSNKQFVTSVSDSTISGGYVGLLAWQDTNPTDVVYSNVQIWIL